MSDRIDTAEMDLRTILEEEGCGAFACSDRRTAWPKWANGVADLARMQRDGLLTVEVTATLSCPVTGEL